MFYLKITKKLILSKRFINWIPFQIKNYFAKVITKHMNSIFLSHVCSYCLSYKKREGMQMQSSQADVLRLFLLLPIRASS